MDIGAGYYYRQGDLGAADGSGVKSRLAYNINDNITIGGTIPTTMLLIHESRLMLKFVLAAQAQQRPRRKMAKSSINAIIITQQQGRAVRLYMLYQPTGETYTTCYGFW